jgi:hypothetical protein
MAPSITTSPMSMGYEHGGPLSAHSKKLTSDKRAFGMEHTPLSANTTTNSNYSSALPETGSPPIWGRGHINNNMGADGSGRNISQMSRDSTQLSEASRGSVFSFLSDDSQEMAGVLQGQGPRQTSSLYGTNFEEEFASVTTKSADTFQSSRGGRNQRSVTPPPPNQRSVPPPPPMPSARPIPQSAAPISVSQTAQSRYHGKPLQQQQEMDIFSSLIQADYGTSTNTGTTQSRVAPPQIDPRDTQYQRSPSTYYSDDEDDSESNLFGDEHSMDDSSAPLYDRMTTLLDPTPWLCRNAKYDADGMPFFDDFSGWTLAGFFRHYLYNPFSPEFTSLQQFCWAIILGVVMGFYTAAWKIM